MHVSFDAFQRTLNMYPVKMCDQQKVDVSKVQWSTLNIFTFWIYYIVNNSFKRCHIMTVAMSSVTGADCTLTT